MFSLAVHPPSDQGTIEGYFASRPGRTTNALSTPLSPLSPLGPNRISTGRDTISKTLWSQGRTPCCLAHCARSFNCRRPLTMPQHSSDVFSVSLLIPHGRVTTTSPGKATNTYAKSNQCTNDNSVNYILRSFEAIWRSWTIKPDQTK